MVPDLLFPSDSKEEAYGVASAFTSLLLEMPLPHHPICNLLPGDPSSSNSNPMLAHLLCLRALPSLSEGLWLHLLIHTTQAVSILPILCTFCLVFHASFRPLSWVHTLILLQTPYIHLSGTSDSLGTELSFILAFPEVTFLQHSVSW